MMMVSLIMVVLAAACQPTVPTTNITSTEVLLPTMTLGQQIIGPLGTPGLRPDVVNQVNPATAVALANRATSTPAYGNCPQESDTAELTDFPDARTSAVQAMLNFLNDGGPPDDLQEQILVDWQAFGEAGYFRDDVDFTGEGEAELVIGYIAPGDVGTLLIFGCEAGRYVQHYEAIADGNDPPQLIWMGEMNNNSHAEAVFASRQCSDAEFCEFQTQIISWSPQQGRFVNLLDETLLTLSIPSVRDTDNDQVSELVINLDSNGTSETGPLRTGVNIYDWNGATYRLSFFELDPPRYRIQLVHEGDKAFSRLEMGQAAQLYELALAEESDLRYWFNDGSETVLSYALYRLLLAYTFDNAGIQIVETLNRINNQFSLEEDQTVEDLPIYIQMAQRFADTMAITNNLNEACTEVRALINENSEALDLLNRYGNRSPSYSALDLCPF